MRTSSEALQAYLAPDETVIAREPGTLLDDSHRSAGVIGITDRRLLFVSEEDGFVDVAHDAIYSIRSRPRREFTVRGMGPMLVAVLGAGVAASAAVGVLLLRPSPAALLLLFATVGGAAAAERVRRRGADIEWRPVDGARAEVLDALEDAEPLRRWLAEAREGGDPDLLVLGITSVALVALVGLVALTERLLVVPLSLVAIGGLGLAEYGYRKQRERDARREGRRPGRQVSVHLVDGRVVHLQVGPDGRLDRDLSAIVRASASPTAEPTRP